MKLELGVFAERGCIAGSSRKTRNTRGGHWTEEVRPARGGNLENVIRSLPWEENEFPKLEVERGGELVQR